MQHPAADAVAKHHVSVLDRACDGVREAVDLRARTKTGAYAMPLCCQASDRASFSQDDIASNQKDVNSAVMKGCVIRQPSVAMLECQAVSEEAELRCLVAMQQA